MSEFEKLEKELQVLTDKFDKYKRENGESEMMDDGHPKRGVHYYYQYYDVVLSNTWWGSEFDESRWQYGKGSLNKSKVKWEIKREKLVNDIKKYTRPFKCDGLQSENWCFSRVHYLEGKCIRTRLEMNWSTYGEQSSDYGFFDCEDSTEDIIDKYGEDYILDFLFEPINGEYDVIIKKYEERANKEENDD